MPFSFLNMALLGAAAGAIIPVIVHLLHRQKAVGDLLPTLGFLKASLAATRRRMRVRHLLVLFLRVLAVLLIVVTLSRPAYRGAFFFRQGSVPVSAVIVVDNSPSMAYKQATRSRFDDAKRLAAKAAKSLPPGSRLALVVTGVGARAESLDRDFTYNTASVASLIKKLEISAQGGDVSLALARAYAMLAREAGRQEASGGREVYVVTDLARHAWKSLGGLHPGAGTGTVILDVGSPADENFHVESASAQWRTAPLPHVEVTATFASGGLAARRLVEVHLAGSKRAETLLDIPVHSRVTHKFEISILEDLKGSLQGWVDLADDDSIKADNSFYFTVPEKREIRCLVIDEDGRGGRPDTGFFLRNALEPPGLSGATRVSVERRNAPTVKSDDLAGRDVVILADVRALSAEMWKTIETFCEAGGGAVFFLGENAEARSYDPFLKKRFDIYLGPLHRQAAPGARLSVLSFDHPIFAAFSGGRNGNIQAARFYRWRILENLPEGSATMELARFDGGDPALLAAPIGVGKVVIAAFSPVGAATDLPLRAAFVPLANEIVAYAAGTAGGRMLLARSNYLVGEPVSLPVEKPGEAAKTRIFTPLGGKPVEMTAAPGARTIPFRAYFPGNYTAVLGKPGGTRRVGFSVNLDPSESQLERMTPKDMRKALPGSVVVGTLRDRRVGEVRGRTRGAREIFDIALVLAVAVLALEEYIANHFYKEATARR